MSDELQMLSLTIICTCKDPEWKFAVFLRNPAERLLSGYLDKVNGSQRDKAHFLTNYNMTYTPTFEQFVRTISLTRTEFELATKAEAKLRGVDWCKNVT
jgi:uridine kinase